MAPWSQTHVLYHCATTYAHLDIAWIVVFLFYDGPTPASLLFVRKILVASRIRTQIIRVEGKDADQSTTTSAGFFFLFKDIQQFCPLQVWQSVGSVFFFFEKNWKPKLLL